MRVDSKSPAMLMHAGPGKVARPVFGLAISLGLHALLFVGVFAYTGVPTDTPDRPAREETLTVLYIRPPGSEREVSAPRTESSPREASAVSPPPAPEPAAPAAVEVVGPRHPASLAAPAAPTAVEGPDQGMVRFRVEIAPDGSMTRLETLWSTSAVAERLARQAIGHMPRSPSTPTGRPLIFEKTISFSPFASDAPPLYKDDCLADTPAFSNPYAWDGTSARAQAEVRPLDKPDTQSMEDCLKQLPKDSIEAESARDQRQMDRWGWSATTPGR
jgi:hypothetical protein